MAADGTLSGRTEEPDGEWVSGADRVMLLAFVADATTEITLREGLSEATPEPFEIKRGGIRAAIAALQKMPTPRSLIVDISNEDEPLSALRDLSQVVEPNVGVLVVGEINDLEFYREVTRGLGVREYLPKPLTRDRVVRLFAPLVVGRRVVTQGLDGGRVITVTGARGGVGATSIATSLAWHFGVARSRHTVLLDPNLQTGTAALYTDGRTGPGLRAALEMPDRIDDLFMERAAQLVQERLHVLAGQEPMNERPVCAVDAAPRLLAALRRRYNFVVVDVPFEPVPLYRDLLDLASQRVIVFEPTLAGIRDALRLRALHNHQNQESPTVMLLNRVGMPGGLTLAQVEDAVEGRMDVTIPDLPKRLAAAANMGEPEIRHRGFFRLRVEDLAQLVAFNRLLDSSTVQVKAKRQAETKRRWLFWKTA
jgi:pilus assembly protein CpaE